MELFEERLLECIGVCMALRAGLSAAFKAHPEPDKLQQALRSIHKQSQPEIAALGPTVLQAFDLVSVELSSQLAPRNRPQT